MEHALKDIFELAEVQAENYSPLALAYIGDCAYELTIRTLLLHKGNAPVDKLNKRASGLAKAGTQAEMITLIFDSLSEEEQAVYKRGRNAKSYTMAKNASVSEYRRATGFEALIGWLYLKGDYERMAEIIRMGFEAIDADIMKKKAEDV
ncbi:MAG: Mini-ribonuclease 3 [Lachnospiraceae bacterium]